MSTTSLRRDGIGAIGIVFMVVAAASPLAAIVGNLPLGFSLGNGAALPETFLLSGFASFCFALGFVKMAPHVRNAAAFYAYIRTGLGRRAGQAAAYVAGLGVYLALAANRPEETGRFSCGKVECGAGEGRYRNGAQCPRVRLVLGDVIDTGESARTSRCRRRSKFEPLLRVAPTQN